MQNYKINSVEIENFGAIRRVKCDNLTGINLIIGKNNTGKTFFLKALSSTIETMHWIKNYKEIEDIKSWFKEIIMLNFKIDRCSDLIRNGQDNLKFYCNADGLEVDYNINRDKDDINLALKNYPYCPKEEFDFQFVPSDTIVSVNKKLFDLFPTWIHSRLALSLLLENADRNGTRLNSQGDIYFGDKNVWYYKENGKKYNINNISDSNRMLCVLNRLFSNGSLKKGAVLFLDGVDSVFHPTEISKLWDMLFDISEDLGIQIFATSHSYFTIKKLCLLAMTNNKSISCISLDGREAVVNDLKLGMPNNSIIEESIRLYTEEIFKML